MASGLRHADALLHRASRKAVCVRCSGDMFLGFPPAGKMNVECSEGQKNHPLGFSNSVTDVLF